MAQSGYGKIVLFNDFAGPEIPVANAVAYGTTAGGCNYYLGDFGVYGDLGEDDTGVVFVEKANGFARISGNNENGKGVFVGTGKTLSPTLNGTVAVESRLEMQAITTDIRVVYVGLMGTLADDAAEPMTSTGTTITMVASDLCGFLLDTQLDNDDEWHTVYMGGTATGETVSTNVESGVTVVAAESDVLRVEVDTDGTARWYINGDLIKTLANAVDPDELQAAGVGCWGVTSTAADVDVDYLAVEFNRDWTR